MWVINVAPETPGYFLLKFGLPMNGNNTGAWNTALDTYVFENTALFTELTRSNADVNFLTGGDCRVGPNNNPCNIGRLSHLTWVPGDGTGGPGGNPGEVPEPASLALLGLGLGLAGMAWRQRRA